MPRGPDVGWGWWFSEGTPEGNNDKVPEKVVVDNTPGKSNESVSANAGNELCIFAKAGSNRIEPQVPAEDEHIFGQERDEPQVFVEVNNEPPTNEENAIEN